MAFTMSDSQQVVCTTAFTDKKGNPVATPTGVNLAWSVDMPNVLTLTPSADGLSCTIIAAGPLSTANVTLSVTDAQGNALASGSLGVTITSGAPSQVVITAGIPSEQP